jgi:hypothetical protein
MAQSTRAGADTETLVEHFFEVRGSEAFIYFRFTFGKSSGTSNAILV